MSYSSHADLGGQADHGPIVAEAEGDSFHAAWEPRALALTLAMGATGAWNLDMGRSARETLPDYAQLSYFEIWIAALQKLMQERGIVQPEEIAAAHALSAGPALPRVLAAGDVASVLARGAPTQRPTTAPGAFAVGDVVRTRTAPMPHHTRLPGYLRGKRGIIERSHGMHVFADAHAQGLGEQPQWLYTVVFDGAELWGESACAGVKVSFDAWEPYLEAAP